MNVNELVPLLELNRDSALSIVLPTGEFIPAHFHVTEIGRIEKNFIDCGGTRRESVSCMLQAWTADDLDHRLTAGKLATIFKMAQPILKSTELPVEIEYGPDVASQYSLTGADVIDTAIHLRLAGKRTDCLAKEKRGVKECCAPGCC
jgi:hypothetical protein